MLISPKFKIKKTALYAQGSEGRPFQIRRADRNRRVYSRTSVSRFQIYVLLAMYGKQQKILPCLDIICRYEEAILFQIRIQIPAGTKIGAGFYIGHRGAVVINERAIIGENCNIANGVTIGQANRGKLKGTPTIGDNVWIGTGAVIVGNINIGSNVLIAPNAFVNVDVPPNSLVLGNPCKIVSKDNPCHDYIKNTYNG